MTVQPTHYCVGCSITGSSLEDTCPKCGNIMMPYEEYLRSIRATWKCLEGHIFEVDSGELSLSAALVLKKPWIVEGKAICPFCVERSLANLEFFCAPVPKNEDADTFEVKLPVGGE